MSVPSVIVVESNSTKLGVKAYSVVHDEGIDLYCGSVLFDLDNVNYTKRYITMNSDEKHFITQRLEIDDLETYNHYKYEMEYRWSNIAEVFLCSCIKSNSMYLYEKWKNCILNIGRTADDINGVKLVLKY